MAKPDMRRTSEVHRPQQRADPETSRWQTDAQNSSIVRDDWGIAHVYGKTEEQPAGVRHRPGRAPASGFE